MSALSLSGLEASGSGAGGEGERDCALGSRIPPTAAGDAGRARLAALPTVPATARAVLQAVQAAQAPRIEASLFRRWATTDAAAATAVKEHGQPSSPTPRFRSKIGSPGGGGDGVSSPVSPVSRSSTSGANDVSLAEFPLSPHHRPAGGAGARAGFAVAAMEEHLDRSGWTSQLARPFTFACGDAVPELVARGEGGAKFIAIGAALGMAVPIPGRHTANNQLAPSCPDIDPPPPECLAVAVTIRIQFRVRVDRFAVTAELTCRAAQGSL